jgi:hypothetical protein
VDKFTAQSYARHYAFSHMRDNSVLLAPSVVPSAAYTYVVCPKRNRTFFLKHLLISLQLNKTCLLQSTPLHCLYTASSVSSSSGTRPGTRFAGWRVGPVANFLLALLSSEIGDLSELISTLGTKKKKVPHGQHSFVSCVPCQGNGYIHNSTLYP